jgi:hypothetical protein
MAYAFCVQTIRYTVLTGYSFRESPLSENLTYAYERWLFQSAAHLQLQSPDNWLSFYVVNNNHHTIDAHLHVNVDGTRAVSPFRASFGSYQCLPAIQPIVLYKFVEFTVSRLHDLGVKELVITNPPAAYQPGTIDLITTFLLNQGFEISVAEPGAVLEVKNNFRERLNAWERRRIRQAEKVGLSFGILPLEELESIYTFILACRIEREYDLSVDWETLRKTVETFPNRFLLFGVRHQSVLAAASIAIDVGNGVMANFHSAHPRDYDHLSPVVLLLEGMVGYCKERDYRILDLGTSAIEGSPNFGLLDFKLGVGATPTTKFTFRRRW